MHILLAHGYFLAEDDVEREVMRPYPPLGLLYISAYLKSRGFSVGVFDATFERREAFEDLLSRERPRVVGLYVNLMTRRSVLPMIRAAKAAGAIVVLGGPEPAEYAGEYLSRGADCVVRGEGELLLERLLQTDWSPAQLAHVPGLAFRSDEGRLVLTGAAPAISRLDDLPFPDRASIDLPRYVDVWRTHHGRGSVSLITARGCPYTCTWCSHSVFGFTHRRRSVGNVADELEMILGTYHPEMVWYADDVFTIHQRWLFDYAAELKRRGVRVPFETISREDRLNEDVVRTLADMGCFRLWIGAESGSQRVLDAMSRGTDAARMREMVRLLQRYGIEAGTFIMFGYEGEEVADLEATVAHLKSALPDRVLTTVAYPIKGTTYYEQVEKRRVPLVAWENGSDRDVAIAGRHSRRFYRHASRWMQSEIALERQRVAGRPDYLRMIKAYAGARAGRMGMAFTARERDAPDARRPEASASGTVTL